MISRAFDLGQLRVDLRWNGNIVACTKHCATLACLDAGCSADTANDCAADLSFRLDLGI